MMPNLAGSTFKKDVEMFKQLFTNPDFMPDLLKIYPLALVKNCQLYKMYNQGKYKPYSKARLTKLLVEIKKHIPYWCRVERVIRDIPSAQIVKGGTKTSNLRQTVQGIMKAEGESCRCIRCREVGSSYNPKEKLYLFRDDYEASDGKEIFLTFENKSRTLLYALLRLRFAEAKLWRDEVRQNRKGELRLPAKTTGVGPQGMLPILKDSSIIREIHTYGQMTPLGGEATATQHKGLGKKLIQEAEKITQQETNLKKIAVISGIGTRGYYKKRKFSLKNTYMIKRL